MSVTLVMPAPRPADRGRWTSPAKLATTSCSSRYHRHGDLDAREELAARFLPVARDLAARYSYTNEPLEDLTQVACLGLMKAIDRFEPGRGSRFMSYAVPTMVGELKRHFRDKCWALHVPRELQERVLNVNRASEALSKRLGRSPTTTEIADALGLSPEARDRGAGGGDRVRHLLAGLASLGDRGRGRDTCSTPSVATRAATSSSRLSVSVAPTVRALPAREQEILRLRFVDDLTQREIGERVGVSQMHVSRLLRRALDKVQAAAEAA